MSIECGSAIKIALILELSRRLACALWRAATATFFGIYWNTTIIIVHTILYNNTCYY